jgi:hypothetical protein
MLRSMRPGTVGGGGGGSYRMGPGGRIEYGHQSHGHWEDDVVVIVTHRFHAGHELVMSLSSRSGYAWRMARRNWKRIAPVKNWFPRHITVHGRAPRTCESESVNLPYPPR